MLETLLYIISGIGLTALFIYWLKIQKKAPPPKKRKVKITRKKK